MKYLINDYKKARDIFIETLNKIPQEKREIIMFGEWNVKDILAHIIGWESQSVQKVKNIQQGKEPVWINDVNVFNAEITSQYKNKSWQIVYEEFLKSGEEMINIYSQLPAHLWHKQAGPNPKFTPERFLKAETEHYQGEHLAQLKKLASQGEALRI